MRTGYGYYLIVNKRFNSDDLVGFFRGWLIPILSTLKRPLKHTINTPAHAVINLLILGKKHNNREALAIVVGAVISDAALIIFYLFHLVLGTPESTIWTVEYYRPEWKAVFDLAHSIPLALLGMLVCWKTGRPWLLIFFTSILLHTLGDLPLHHSDAYRHFFPLSDWRFISPVSYWNPAYYGNWISSLEVLTVAIASIYMYIKRPQMKIWVVGTGVIYLLYWIYIDQTWS